MPVATEEGDPCDVEDGLLFGYMMSTGVNGQFRCVASLQGSRRGGDVALTIDAVPAVVRLAPRGGAAIIATMAPDRVVVCDTSDATGVLSHRSGERQR
jgi:hypothetical protein